MTDQPICEWDSIPNPAYNVFTIGNTSEVMPGIMTPLLATIVQVVDHLAVRSFHRQVGIEDLVSSFEPPLANFISCFAGRCSLNIGWANAVTATWTVSGQSDLMAQFITSTEGRDIAARATLDVERAQRNLERVREVWEASKTRLVPDQAEIGRRRSEHAAVAFGDLSAAEVWGHVDALFEWLGERFATHLLVSGAGGEHASQLGQLLGAHLPDFDPALIVGLTSGLGDVESAAPGKAIWDLARFAAGHPELAQALRTEDAAAIDRRMSEAEDSVWRELRQRFKEFLGRYGHRGEREVDPLVPAWEDEPAFVISAIRACLDAPAERDPHRSEAEAAARRGALEAQVEAGLPEAVRDDFRRILLGAQTYARLRETSKNNWVRSMRLLRRPLLDLAERMAARGVIARPDDIAFVTLAEVRAWATDTAPRAGATALIARRRVEVERLQSFELPEVFEPPVAPIATARPQQATGALKGMAVSPGVATGKARIVLSAQAAQDVTLEPGEVLVAPYTDAPWTPLFVPAAAVVAETGGVLSHAATVAREYGIPAVVAVKGATTLIKDGQLITVDALKGEVVLH